jgi:hypothetical protein
MVQSDYVMLCIKYKSDDKMTKNVMADLIFFSEVVVEK